MYAKFAFVCNQYRYIHVVTTIVKLLIWDQMEINLSDIKALSIKKKKKSND